MNQEKIGMFIAQERKNKNLTQEQLANKLGVTSKSISRWENGKTMPDISLFEPLCDELNITINELLKGQRLDNKKNQSKMQVESLIDYSKYIKNKNKKIILTILFIMSLLPMLMNQYGGLKGVQEISGLINLFNPIGIVSVIIFFIGVWFPFKHNNLNKIIGGFGVVGIVISEIYKYLTWYIQNITGKFNIYNSIRFAFPEFYIGLGISLLIVIIYFYVDKIIKE